MFVESGLGLRVKFDLGNTVYLTVMAEHLSATRGLCGVYNNNADGQMDVHTIFSLHVNLYCVADIHSKCLCGQCRRFHHDEWSCVPVRCQLW